MKTKYLAKKIGKGLYLYRGYTIEAFNHSTLLDHDLRGTEWYIYEPSNPSFAIQIESKLKYAKSAIDQILSNLTH